MTAISGYARDKLVPINQQYKLADLIEACRQFPGLSWTHKITWEYVMLKGMAPRFIDLTHRRY